MRIVVRKLADGSFRAYPRGHRALAAAGRDYNAALDALHDLLRAQLRAGTLPPGLNGDPPPRPAGSKAG